MSDNYASRDLATIAHPYANLATLPDTGPLVIERQTIARDPTAECINA